tara:strand:- start:1130 stop:1381 length:252 start_codon:yes stop_codon:yes gene_type:complete
MQFFLNRPEGGKKAISGDPEFFAYFYKCAVYNVIWDAVEKYPSSATFFWDENEESVGVKFPPDGVVMKELQKRKVPCVFDEDE